jgi:hypothetical protein
LPEACADRTELGRAGQVLHVETGGSHSPGRRPDGGLRRPAAAHAQGPTVEPTSLHQLVVTPSRHCARTATAPAGADTPPNLEEVF